MAKTLKQILDGVKSSKIKSKDILGSKPGVDYRPKAGDEQKFADKHKIEQHADRVGNGDDVYQANNVAYSMDKKKHGYKSGEDEKVYEEAKCNMTEEGKLCEMHGMKACPSSKMLKEKPVKEEAIDEISRDLASRYIAKTNPDYSSPAEIEKRKEGRALALKKKWGDKNFGTAEPRVKATEEVEQIDEILIQQYISGPKNKSAQVRKNMNTDNYSVKKITDGTVVGISNHNDVSAAHAAAKKHINEEDLDESPVKEDAAKDEYVKLPSGFYKHIRTGNVFTSPPKLPHKKETSKYVKDPSGYTRNLHTGRLESKDWSEEVEQVSEPVVQIGEGYGTDLSRGLSASSLIKKNTGHKVHFKPNGQMIHTDSNKVITQNADNHSVPELIQHAKSFKEEVELEEKALAKSKQTVLVTAKGTKSAGGVMRIKKSEYDPKKHDLAEGDIEERKMTSGEMAKREDIVKGMKKKLSDFRARYGNRAKDVMYATATKSAMKEDIAESAIPSDSAIRDYKRKDVRGLYNFSHLEHPNGNYIQHNQNKYVHYNKKTGEHKSFSRTESGLKDLVKHVDKAHSVKEDLAQPLIGATSAPSNGKSDEEAAMVKTELRALANKAMHLVTQMPQGMDIEPWVQSKIAQAKEMVSSVHDYMIYGDHKQEKEQTDTPITFPNTNVDTGRI